MGIKAVIFDLDNTLYDEKQFVTSGFKAVSNYVAEKFGTNRKKFYHLLLSIFLEQGRGKVFDLALKKLNLYEKEVVSEMVEVYRKHFPDIRLYEDAIDVLLQLKKKYLVGLITDGIKEIQKNKVEALRIENLFDVIMYADEYGGKNSTQVFLVTLKKMKVKPLESIYVGDNPLKDFVRAKKLGLHTVRVLRGEHRNLRVDKKYDAEYEIKDLQQLFGVIQRLQ